MTWLWCTAAFVAGGSVGSVLTTVFLSRRPDWVLVQRGVKDGPVVEWAGGVYRLRSIQPRRKRRKAESEVAAFREGTIL